MIYDPVQNALLDEISADIVIQFHDDDEVNIYYDIFLTSCY